jgi:flagellar biosynthesis/type III secretory pathway protein FliH
VSENNQFDLESIERHKKHKLKKRVKKGLKKAYKKGFKEGFKNGLKAALKKQDEKQYYNEAEKVVRDALSKGIDVQTIIEITGLSEKEVDKIIGKV